MEEATQIGAYRLLRKIGEGGMGAVWLAEHAMLGRRAAIKVLHPEHSSRPDIVTRFFNEARAATSIADPGIVQVFDFGQHTDGTAYIVMELLEGEPLDLRIARAGALEPADALRIMRQVAGTLGVAHARGIVHRDLKPENVFIVRDPEVAGGERAKVLDFGIAKLASDRRGVKTHTFAVFGTPGYMSPEQCRGAGRVDPRSDVYALGCMLFTLLVGHPPFIGKGVGDFIAMHLREPPPAPSSQRPGIPPELDRLVLRCLAKDPEQRFAHAGELALELGDLLRSLPQMDPLGPGAAGDHSSQLTTLSALTGTDAAASRPARTRRLAALAGFGAVVIGVVTAIAATGGGSSSPARPLLVPESPSVVAPPPEAAPPPEVHAPATEAAPRITDVLGPGPSADPSRKEGGASTKRGKAGPAKASKPVQKPAGKGLQVDRFKIPIHRKL